MKTCKVYFSRLAKKQLEKIPENISRKAYKWADTVEEIGLSELQKRPGLHDEPLKGDRIGQRSVRLNRSYRIIYSLKDGLIFIEILVIEVHNHDY